MYDHDSVWSELKDLGKLSIDLKKSIISFFYFFVNRIDQAIKFFFIQTSTLKNRLPTAGISLLFEDRSSFLDM
jgi:hypothetical protein